MILHKIKEFCIKLFSVWPNRTQKFRAVITFKTSSNKTTIQMRLVGVFKIFRCTAHGMSPRNKPLLIFNHPTCSYFFSQQNGLIKSFSSFKIYLHTKCNYHTLIGSSFSSASEILTSAVKQRGYGIKNLCNNNNNPWRYSSDEPWAG
jgi:hypothetical protein